VEEDDDVKSDARDDIFKSHSEVESNDYGVEHYRSLKTRKSYVPVFVPEVEKKKSTYSAYFPLLILEVLGLYLLREVMR